MEKKAVHVSVMTGKLKGFKAINVNPLTSVFCQKMHQVGGTICRQCYSTKMLKTFRQSCAAVFTQNAVTLKEPLDDWQIPRFMPGEAVRFLAHGDLDTAQQLRGLYQIANANPKTVFSMWTKRKDLVFQLLNEKPKNLRNIQSSIFLDIIDERRAGFDAVFTVFSSAAEMPRVQDGVVMCNGKHCLPCMYCYTKPTASIIELLKK